MRRLRLVAASGLAALLASAVWLGWMSPLSLFVSWIDHPASPTRSGPLPMALPMDWANLDARPIQAGAASVGGTCPVSDAHPPPPLGVIPEPAAALNPWRIPVKHYTVIVWQLIGEPYTGPIVVRGGRLSTDDRPLMGVLPAPNGSTNAAAALPDGPVLRVGKINDSPLPLFGGMRMAVEAGVESWWTYVYVDKPGCYFWQEDLGPLTLHLIFQATG